MSAASTPPLMEPRKPPTVVSVRRMARRATPSPASTVVENASKSASSGSGVSDAAETRRKLGAGLEMLRSKREELPARKHGNVPL